MTHLPAPSRRISRPAQRGVAALAVVMVLFFVVSLVAAYTNRNLIFEQRTAANQYRSTQSFEAAQAGIDWAVALLNQGRIDASCAPSANLADLTFRQRHISIDPNTGVITPNLRPDGTSRTAACAFDGTNWGCSCPVDGAPTPPGVTGTGTQPAYQVRLVVPNITLAPGEQPAPGLVRIESVACPRMDAACLAFDNNDGAEGRVRITVLVALQSSSKTTPAAPLTVRGNIAIDPSATLEAHNSDIVSGGIAVHTGGTLSGGITTTGVAGAPSSFAVLQDDPSLRDMVAAAPLLPTVQDRMFASFFGLTPTVYRQQPAAVVLGNCPCTAAAVRTAISLNPGRPIWVDGNLQINSAGNIGSATEPVTVVVNGNITATSDITFYGVLYSRAANWAITGPSTFRGGAIAESVFSGNGSANFVYDPALLQRLRVTSGSFVIVPGSWRDFPDVAI